MVDAFENLFHNRARTYAYDLFRGPASKFCSDHIAASSRDEDEVRRGRVLLIEQFACDIWQVVCRHRYQHQFREVVRGLVRGVIHVGKDEMTLRSGCSDHVRPFLRFVASVTQRLGEIRKESVAPGF